MCVDINECHSRTDNCDTNAYCINTHGSFRCICRAGFIGNGVTCTAQQTQPCRPGFRPWGSMCVDINECATNDDNCDDNAVCTNTLGSFRCTCRSGFAGNGVLCLPLVPCDLSDQQQLEEETPEEETPISRTPGGRIRTSPGTRTPGTRRTEDTTRRTGTRRTTRRGRSLRQAATAVPPIQRLCVLQPGTTPGTTPADTTPADTTVTRTPGRTSTRGTPGTRTGTPGTRRGTRGTRRG